MWAVFIGVLFSACKSLHNLILSFCPSNNRWMTMKIAPAILNATSQKILSERKWDCPLNIQQAVSDSVSFSYFSTYEYIVGTRYIHDMLLHTLGTWNCMNQCTDFGGDWCNGGFRCCCCCCIQPERIAFSSICIISECFRNCVANVNYFNWSCNLTLSR